MCTFVCQITWWFCSHNYGAIIFILSVFAITYFEMRAFSLFSLKLSLISWGSSLCSLVVSSAHCPFLDSSKYSKQVFYLLNSYMMPHIFWIRYILEFFEVVACLDTIDLHVLSLILLSFHSYAVFFSFIWESYQSSVHLYRYAYVIYFTKKRMKFSTFPPPFIHIIVDFYHDLCCAQITYPPWDIFLVLSSLVT